MSVIIPRWNSAAAITAAVLALVFPVHPAGAAAEEQTLTGGLCASGAPAVTQDDLGGFTAPCATARGNVTIEMLYFQNASRVGQSALAAYPHGPRAASRGGHRYPLAGGALGP